MCELATESAPRLMVDPWEALQPRYMPTAQVLDHFEHEINEVLGGAERPDGSRVPVRIVLLAGADLIQTMSTPGVWSEQDLDHILGRFGTFIIERTGTDIDDALANLQPWKHNIYVIQQLVTYVLIPNPSGFLSLTRFRNDISSTKIRMFLRREMSIQYLLPAPVVEYIEQNGLYEEDGTSSVEGKGKGTGEGSGRDSPAVASSSRS